MMRIKKPEKYPIPQTANLARHPMELAGLRWMPTLAMAPANLLQLQKAAGNQAVVELLKQYIDPKTGSLSSLKTYRAARNDNDTPPSGLDSEKLMKTRDPRLGDWNFHFVADTGNRGTALYWVTLNQFKNRQRHILIDPATMKPLDVTGRDLDERDRKLLAEWAVQMLGEQLSGQTQPPAPPKPAPSPNASKEEKEELSALFEDGGDEGDAGETPQ